MSRFYLILIILVLVAKSIHAQEEITITGKVVDHDFEPISNCKITEVFNTLTIKTDKKGNFTLPIKLKPGNTIKIQINHFSFAPFEKTFTVEANELSSEIMLLDIVLEPLEIDVVDIFAGPQTIFKSDKLNVSDFEFQGENILLLTYEKRPGNNQRLILTNNSGKIIASKSVGENATDLMRDYNDNIHLIQNSEVYFISIINDRLLLMIEDPIQFQNYVKPLVGKLTDNIYISNYSWHYPAFSYYAYNTIDSSIKTLHYVEDKFLLELYRAEYKYVDTRTKLEATRMEYKTGVDKEIWAAVWNGFPNSLYYKPVYAPMFTRNDTVMIFDHYTNHLYYFNDNNILLDSVQINYHIDKENPGWKKKMLKDDINGKIYSLYENNGFFTIAELGVNGTTVKKTMLQFKYPEKIRVHNGYVYFNYRPFESLQNKFLYKQVLN